MKLYFSGAVRKEDKNWTKLNPRNRSVMQNEDINLQCLFKLMGEFEGNQAWTKIQEKDGKVNKLLTSSHNTLKVRNFPIDLEFSRRK
jgi:hypothetical protein